MASQYFVTIKLDPHYQQFLRSHFMCDVEIFEFPARNMFNKLIEWAVVPKRKAQIEHGEGVCSFKIALPCFKTKNPAFFRYFTEIGESVFVNEIKDYYNYVIQKKIKELLTITEKQEDGTTRKLDRQACTWLLIQEYGFNKGDKDAFERLYKFYTRYDQNVRFQKFWNKKKTEELLLTEKINC
jgi:hypothetical protein